MDSENAEQVDALNDSLPWASDAVDDPSDTHAIAMVALELHPTWTLGRLFGTVPLDLPISDLGLTARADGRLRKAGHTSFGDFSDSTVSDLFDIRSMGAKSIVDILRSLTDVALIGPLTEGPGGDVDAEPLHSSITRQPISPEIVDVPQIRLLAQWLMSSGRPASPLTSIDENDDRIPADVRRAAQWHRSLTPLSIGARIDRVPAMLDLILARFDDRQLDVVTSRFLDPGSATLDEIGQRWGVSRERIRQLETKLLSPLQEAFSTNDGLQMAAAGLRHQLAPMMSLDRLLESNLDLSTPIASVGLPAWQVLDKFDDEFESDGKWVCRPSLGHLREETTARIQSLSSGHGAASVHDVIDGFLDWTSINAAELLEWIADCGHIVSDDVVYSPTVRSIPDRAAAILSLRAHPMTAEEIHSSAVPDRAITSLANAMAEDDRICRVGLDTWGLTEWDIPEYTNIRDAICSALDEVGQLPAQDLAEQLHSQFGVSMASVTMYSAAWPFETVAGHVRYAQSKPTSRATLTDARRSYRVDPCIVIRIPVTTDHLRGSGSPAPAGLLSALGMEIADKRTFHNSIAAVTLSWEPLNPSFSSVRSHVTALDLGLGDELKLTFDGQNVEVSALESVPEESPSQWILRRFEVSDLSVSALAERLDRPAASTWAEILSILRKRGEEDSVEMLLDALAGPQSDG